MLTLRAYAKLNLYLAVTGKQPNGYHSLDMIMQTVSLYDTVSLKRASSLKLDCPGVPPQKNTAYLAAISFFEALGIPPCANILIEKNIPSQAGLGGASADAAAVFVGLNGLWGFPLSQERLAELALSIGADVPFFLSGGCMRARGIGEQLSPVASAFNPVYLIVKPASGVSTPQAYARYDALPPEAAPPISECLQALALNDPNRLAHSAYNALTRPACELCPEIEEILISLRRHSNICFMTGSGSACAALFPSEREALPALRAFQSQACFCALARNTKSGVERLGETR